jgi:FAD/FMN-containing dehydrogenase
MYSPNSDSDPLPLPNAVMMRSALPVYISGWGRTPRVHASGYDIESFEEILPLLQKETGDIIVHALGRSYGDSSLSRNVILTRRMNAILNFDPDTGIVTCESGVSLSDLIDVFLPRGWFLTVTPGTKFITVGGAIAGDVHGKNHHRAGCFSKSVIRMDVLIPSGRIITCSSENHRDLFLATCGGMGLTGVILSAAFQLQPVQSAFINQEIIKCENLSETIEAFSQYHHKTYSVAWIDCLSQGKQMGRSLLMVGEHATSGRLRLPEIRGHCVPFDVPGFFLNSYSVSLFNALYYAKTRRRYISNTVSLNAFFYPLDAILQWNRMYGKNGFTQYQLVLPLESSHAGLKAILTRIARSGLGSFLAVLKLFGPGNKNYLSFPLKGFTLALDFKMVNRLLPLLDELDRIVLDHGGRIYLSKDVRMKPETFQKSYPDLDRFREIRRYYGAATRFNSLQSRRLEI